MTSPPAGPASAPGSRPLRTRPTGAFLAAVTGGAAALALAVLLGRPALVLVGLPLLAWATVAVAGRVLRGVERGEEPPVVLTGRRVLEEGGSSTAAVRARPGTLLGVTVPLQPHLALTPRHGSTAGAGEVRFRVSSRRWGRIRLGPMPVVLSDPLGAFRTQTTVHGTTMQVVPSASALDAPTEVPSAIGVSGSHLSRRRGDGTALSEVREFRPGDRLHRITWRATSRTGRLHTNATFTEQDTDVLIVTDTTADVQPAPWSAPEDATSLDMTVRATAAIARHYLGAGDRVALFDMGHLIGPVRPGTGGRQLRVIVDALSRAARDDGALHALRRLRSVRPGTLVVVCTPLLSDQVVEQIGVLVAHGGDVVVVDTLPPSVGDVATLPARPRRRDGASAERFWPEAWVLRRMLRERTVRELREAGVPVTAWEGASSLAPVLLSLAAAGSAPRLRRS